LARRKSSFISSAENVSVSGGGRAALTRAAASLGDINLGHFLPDYTAYEELLDIFRAFTAIPILLEGERGYALPVEDRPTVRSVNVTRIARTGTSPTLT
jgi:hypothetical protein